MREYIPRGGSPYRVLEKKASIVMNYVQRGAKLMNISLWDFIAQVGKKRKDHRKRKSVDEEPAVESNDVEPMVDNNDEDIQFQDEHPQETEDTNESKYQVQPPEHLLNIPTKSRPSDIFQPAHNNYNTHLLVVRHPRACYIVVPVGPGLP
jgi:hypothetical protein